MQCKWSFLSAKKKWSFQFKDQGKLILNDFFHVEQYIMGPIRTGGTVVLVAIFLALSCAPLTSCVEKRYLKVTYL